MIRITIDDNRLIEITIAEDLQIHEIHKMFHKTDTADQIAKTASIELITQGQTQTEVIARTTTEIVPIQTLEIGIIQTTDPEILPLNETGIT